MSGLLKTRFNMETLHVLDQANRQSGDWLPSIRICPQRVKPCGNAFCLDEAMRSAQTTSEHSSEHALDHAHQIARRCPASVCPAEVDTGLNRHVVIDILAQS